MDKIITKFFIGCGIPFNVFESNHFKQMIFDAGHYGPRYLLPSYEKLRTTLLKEVKNDLIKDLDVVRESWKEIGCTITCDGWTSVDNKPILNILCICPKGDYFLQAIDTIGKTKVATYIADTIYEEIEKVGSENVVEVVTNNVEVCKSAGRIIEDKYPHITYSGYIAHGIDLVLEDIGKSDWVHKIVNEARTNIKFITNHHKSQALFREFSSKVNNMELLRLGDTRFETNFYHVGKVAKSQKANSSNDCEFRMEKLDVFK
jgi:hypothetical protein